MSSAGIDLPGNEAAAEVAPLAGFRCWGPGVAGANAWWPRRPAVQSLSPPPVKDDRQQLIATGRGAVLVMLPEAATPHDVLAALEAAHTQIQRELLARRRAA